MVPRLDGCAVEKKLQGVYSVQGGKTKNVTGHQIIIGTVPQREQPNCWVVWYGTDANCANCEQCPHHRHLLVPGQASDEKG
jgi:hypothetical protein